MKKSAARAHMPPPSPLPHSREPSIPHRANTFLFSLRALVRSSYWVGCWDASPLSSIYCDKSLRRCSDSCHFWLQHTWYKWVVYLTAFLDGCLKARCMVIFSVTSLLNALTCPYMLYMCHKTPVEVYIARKAIEQVLHRYTVCLFTMWNNVPEAVVGAF